VKGTYVITGIDSVYANATTSFEYNPTGAITATNTQSTTTQTVTGPTTTVTGPASTITSTAPPTTLTSTQTATLTSTSTVTQTTSTTPDWAYGAMVLLLVLGLAIGYVVKRPSVKQT